MIFSKSCEYALRSVLFICMKSNNGKNLSVLDIAEEIGSPKPYTAKILQLLTKQNIIQSVKGPNGGFFIDKQHKPITILQIIEAVEGDKYLNRCLIGLKDCSEKRPCPLHQHFVKQRNEIINIFKTKTIHDLIIKEKGKIFLK